MKHLLKKNIQKILFLLLACLFSNVINAASHPQFKSKEDSLIFFWEQAKQNGDVKLQIEYLDALCCMYRTESLWDKHDAVNNELLNLGIKEKNRDVIAEAYNYMGMSRSLNGDNPGAIENFKKTLAMNLEAQDSSSISNMMENIGMVFLDMAMYDSAMVYYMGSMRIREKLGHERLLHSYTDIAILYSCINDISNQEKYLLKAREVIKSTGDSDYQNLAIWHNTWAGLLNDKGLKDSLEFHYSKVYDYSQKAGWKMGMSVAAGNLAALYYENGEVQKALDAHFQVVDLAKEINLVVGVAEEYVYIAEIYYETGEYTEALAYAHDALKLSDKHGFNNFKRDALRILNETYEQMHMIDKAYHYHKEYVAIKDSLFNIEKVELISEMENRYEAEKKEQHIQLLYSENQIKNQQIQLGVIAIALLLMIAFIVYLYFYIQKRQSKLIEVGLQHKLSRAQLNPHFLSNAMASIQRYVIEHDAESASKYLGKFSQLNRSVLEHSLVESISVSEEIDMLNSYLEFEQLRMGNAFTYKIEADKHMETEIMYIPPLFIQPFVENAIKHGLKDCGGDGIITIRFTDLNTMIRVEVIDNGKGLHNKAEDGGDLNSSRSLQIIRKRLRLLRRKYPKLPDLSLLPITNSYGGGTIVTIHLPLI